MTCRDAGLREDAAFVALKAAVAHRQRINAKLAIYDDHWDGYEAALNDLEAALNQYGSALAELRHARSLHVNVGAGEPLDPP